MALAKRAATLDAVSYRTPDAAARDAAIAAWLSVAGDRRSQLRDVLRGVTELESNPQGLSPQEIEANHELLLQLLAALDAIED
jgi:hypothetical protein